MRLFHRTGLRRPIPVAEPVSPKQKEEGVCGRHSQGHSMSPPFIRLVDLLLHKPATFQTDRDLENAWRSLSVSFFNRSMRSAI
jgi:hypothetical protein